MYGKVSIFTSVPYKFKDDKFFFTFFKIFLEIRCTLNPQSNDTFFLPRAVDYQPEYFPQQDKKTGHLVTSPLHSQPDLTQGATSATPPLLPPPPGSAAVFYEYPPYAELPSAGLNSPCSEHHYDVPLLAPPPQQPPPPAPGTASTASLASSSRPPPRSGSARSLSSFSSCKYFIIMTSLGFDCYQTIIPRICIVIMVNYIVL